MNPSGAADRATRAVLFALFMDKVCVDRKGVPYKLAKSDFLAKGARADGKGDFQGCGEFNPFLVFSEEQAAFFAGPSHVDQEGDTRQKQRNDANGPNRRVMALLFKPGTVVSPGKWPCPTVKEGVAGCKARFWSDGETRRNPQAETRTFDETKDTYGCRFYHRLFAMSPCGAGDATLPTVLEIRAAVPGTKGVRDPAKQRRRNILRASTSTDSSLTGNPPVILVQGCNEVELEASISAPIDVTWSVTPTENTNAAPAVSPDAGSPNQTKATLSSSQAGSFSVTASIGASKVVWNVVFVSVVVDLERALVTLRDDRYVDNGSDRNFTSFRSGLFDQGDDQYPFLFKINNVTLVGGGNDKKLGIDRVELHVLQNGVEDTLSGHYQGGATALEQPHSLPGQPVFPVTDSNGDANGNPFGDAGRDPMVEPNQTDAIRTWTTGDSPTGAFPRNHNGRLLQRVDGVNGFRTTLASVSLDASSAIVVHAENFWKSDYSGDVAVTGTIGTYTANGAHTISNKVVALISPATNGTDAGKAGFDTFEPRFNNGTQTTFS